ncbi:MAG: helix-turn-helix transcriptional regulator [Clostridia bacterium]|nr:helix-turn-helix transcriptional regulator [Clostridia bacterium]
MRIKEIRKEKGLTQSELAQVMKVGQTTVCQWESGVRSPRAKQLPELARALGCTLDELYGVEG